MITAMLSLYKEFGMAADKRTIPNSIDCLRNVERRILLVLYQLSASNKLIKSARVIGDCIGKYHPHGDIATYGVLQQLVKDEYVRGKGGWGNIGRLKDGKAAAYRYTECKLNAWVKKLAFEYIKYVPMSKIIVLDDEEPEYLPSPISIGLIGNGLITGIGGFYSTLIPKYKITDLAKRLLWILENKNTIFNKKQLINDINENEKLFGPCIIPHVKNCVVNEVAPGEFYNILYNGCGSITYSPMGNIINYDKKTAPHGQIITVNGRAPNSTYRQLIEATIKSDTEEPKLKCDIIDGDLRIGEILRIIPRKNDKPIEEYAQEIWERYLTKKIEIAVNICDENDEIKLKGIDYILYNSFSKWKLCVYKSVINEFRKVVTNLYESIVIMDIIHPIILNNKITNRNEIIKLFNESDKNNYEIPLIEFNEIEETYFSYNRKVTPEDILKIIAEKKIFNLIEFNLDIQKINQKIIDAKNNIDNIQTYCIDYIKNLIKGI